MTGLESAAIRFTLERLHTYIHTYINMHAGMICVKEVLKRIYHICIQNKTFIWYNKPFVNQP